MNRSALKNRIDSTAQVKDRVVLHKVRKHWKAIGLSALLLLGGTAAFSTNANAANVTSAPAHQVTNPENGGGNLQNASQLKRQSAVAPARTAANVLANQTHMIGHAAQQQAQGATAPKSAQNNISSTASQKIPASQVSSGSFSVSGQNGEPRQSISSAATKMHAKLLGNSMQQRWNPAYEQYVKTMGGQSAYDKMMDNEGKQINSNENKQNISKWPVKKLSTSQDITGTFQDGTAKWILDNNGNLLIHDGTLPYKGGWTRPYENCTYNEYDLFWAGHMSGQERSSIKHVSFSNATCGYSLPTMIGTPNIQTVDLSGLTMTNTVPISNANLFSSLPRLKAVYHVNNIFNANVVSDGSMFFGDPELTTVDGLGQADMSGLKDTNQMFSHDASLKSIDFTNFNTTTAINNTNKNGGDVGAGSDGLTNIISNCRGLKQLTLGPHTVLTNSAINGDRALSYGQNINSGQQFGEDLHQLADSQPHPGTYNMFHGRGGEYQNTNDSALWALQNDGTLFLENGTLSVEPNASNFHDWNDVKQVIFHNVNSPQNENILNQINDIAKDNTGVNDLTNNGFIKQNPSAANVVNSAKGTITSAYNYVLNSGFNAGSAANADYDANEAYSNASAELELATQQDIASQNASNSTSASQAASSAASAASSSASSVAKSASSAVNSAVTFASQAASSASQQASQSASSVASAAESSASSAVASQSASASSAIASQSTSASNAIASQSTAASQSASSAESAALSQANSSAASTIASESASTSAALQSQSTATSQSLAAQSASASASASSAESAAVSQAAASVAAESASASNAIAQASNSASQAISTASTVASQEASSAASEADSKINSATASAANAVNSESASASSAINSTATSIQNSAAAQSVADSAARSADRSEATSEANSVASFAQSAENSISGSIARSAAAQSVADSVALSTASSAASASIASAVNSGSSAMTSAENSINNSIAAQSQADANARSTASASASSSVASAVSSADSMFNKMKQSINASAERQSVADAQARAQDSANASASASSVAASDNAAMNGMKQSIAATDNSMINSNNANDQSLNNRDSAIYNDMNHRTDSMNNKMATDSANASSYTTSVANSLDNSVNAMSTAFNNSLYNQSVADGQHLAVVSAFASASASTALSQAQSYAASVGTASAQSALAVASNDINTDHSNIVSMINQDQQTDSASLAFAETSASNAVANARADASNKASSIVRTMNANTADLNSKISNLSNAADKADKKINADLSALDKNKANVGDVKDDIIRLTRSDQKALDDTKDAMVAKVNSIIGSQSKTSSAKANLLKSQLETEMKKLEKNVQSGLNSKADWFEIGNDESKINSIASQLNSKADLSSIESLTNQLIDEKSNINALQRRARAPRHIHSLNELREGQSGIYHGKLVTRLSMRSRAHYIRVIRGLCLHDDVIFSRKNRRGIIPIHSGRTIHIDKMFIVNYRGHKLIRLVIRAGRRHYFITGRRSYVRNAYLQANDVKRRHWIVAKRNTGVFGSKYFTKRTYRRTLRRGHRIYVKKLFFLNRNSKLTRFYIGHGLYVSANSNLVRMA